MTRTVEQSIDWDQAPRGLDGIAADLRAMRSAAGDPSFAEIARRISGLRTARKPAVGSPLVARSTVYDCFREGRRRVDAETVADIATVLGLPDDLAALWRARVRAARTAADGAGVVGVRDDVPDPVEVFTGRQQELERAERVLLGDGPGRMLWITGIAGTGKTQLALQLGARLAERGVPALFIDLRGYRSGAIPVAPEAAQRAILRALGVTDADAAAPTGLTRRLTTALRESGRVLILDDAAGPEQVERILGRGHDLAVVVTSRSRAEGDAVELPLAGLSAQETSELLRSLVEAAGGGGPEISEEEAARLTEICEGLPLAIVLVGGRLAARPGWTLADHIDLLSERVREGRIDDGIRSALDASYAELDAGAARLLRGIADLALSEVDVPVLAAVLEGSEDDAAALAGTLVKGNLAIGRGEGRVALHALVRAFALDRAEDTDSPSARRDAFARVATAQAQQTWAAYDALLAEMGETPATTTFAYPPRAWSASEARAWLTAQLPALLALAHQAPQRGRPDLLFRISEGLHLWMNLSGLYASAIALHEAAADVAEEIGDMDALAQASLHGGMVRVLSDDLDQARELFAKVQPLVEGGAALTDPGLLGVLRNMEATVLMRQGRLDRAITLLQGAVELHDDLQETMRFLSALTNLGVALHMAGRFSEETEVLARGQRAAVAADNFVYRAFFGVNRAGALIENGELEQAARDIAEVREILAEHPMLQLLVVAEGLDADLHRRQGDLVAARTHFLRGMEEAQATGMELSRGELSVIGAQIAADEGDRDQALTLLSDADGLLAAGGDALARGQVLRIRADLAEDAEQREAYLREAIEVYESGGATHVAAQLREANSPAAS